MIIFILIQFPTKKYHPEPTLISIGEHTYGKNGSLITFFKHEGREYFKALFL